MGGENAIGGGASARRARTLPAPRHCRYKLGGNRASPLSSGRLLFGTRSSWRFFLSSSCFAFRYHPAPISTLFCSFFGPGGGQRLCSKYSAKLPCRFACRGIIIVNKLGAFVLDGCTEEHLGFSIGSMIQAPLSNPAALEWAGLSDQAAYFVTGPGSVDWLTAILHA